jgi:hypothetical protein
VASRAAAIKVAYIRPKTRRGAMNTTNTAVVKLAIEVITLPEVVSSEVAVLYRSGWFHARRRLFAERIVPRRAARY